MKSLLIPIILIWGTALGAPPSKYVGKASWYGKSHQGKPMANGKKFDYRKMTAAMWGIPFGTRVHVVNLENGKSVDLTITDRGPAKRLHRVIDVSEAAAVELDFKTKGLTTVFVSPILEADYERADNDIRNPIAKVSRTTGEPEA